jgi:uncharacterized membrane protein YfcA
MAAHRLPQENIRVIFIAAMALIGVWMVLSGIR